MGGSKSVTSRQAPLRNGGWLVMYMGRVSYRNDVAPTSPSWMLRGDGSAGRCRRQATRGKGTLLGEDLGRQDTSRCQRLASGHHRWLSLLISSHGGGSEPQEKDYGRGHGSASCGVHVPLVLQARVTTYPPVRISGPHPFLSETAVLRESWGSCGTSNFSHPIDTFLTCFHTEMLSFRRKPSVSVAKRANRIPLSLQ